MKRDDFKIACFKFLGVPYLWGGSSPMGGLDCSGLVQELYAIIGLNPLGDQSAQGLHDIFKAQAHTEVADLGSLAFYGEDETSITHVALCIDEHTKIEAAGGGSKTVDLRSAIDQKAFVKLRPIHNRSDLICIIRPALLDTEFT